MNTTNLNTFLAVMQTGSISQAADKLFITQPAVSKRIKNLEDEFDVALFDTVGRGIIPTQAAYDLVPHARRWLDDYNNLKINLKKNQQTVSGKLVIGTSHHIGLHHLPVLLKSFMQEYPDVQLDVHFIDSEQAHKAVLDGDLSLAFLTLPPTQDKRLHYFNLWQDRLHFVTGSDSPLAKKHSVTLEELTQFPAILPAANTFTSQITLAEFAKHGLKPYATMSTNPLESIRMLVSIGLGWSVLPETLLNEDLQLITFTEPLILTRDLGLVMNPNITVTGSMSALLAFLGLELPDTFHIS